MSGELLAAVIVFIIFFSIVTVIRIIANNNIRRKLIERDLVNEKTKYLYTSTFEGQVPSSLKWGIVLIGVGLAILIGQMLPSDISDEVTISGMFIFAGLGLILYYFLASRIMKKSEKKNSQ